MFHPDIERSEIIGKGWQAGAKRKPAGVVELKKMLFNDELFYELFLKIQSTTPALIRLHLGCILILATPPIQEGSLFSHISKTFSAFEINKDSPQ